VIFETSFRDRKKHWHSKNIISISMDGKMKKLWHNTIRPNFSSSSGKFSKKKKKKD